MLRGDLQEHYEDFDPENIYAPLAVHETLRMFLAKASAEDLILEGAEAENAYLHSRLNVLTIMEQPTSSTQILGRPDCYCLLHMSLYGARQAEML